MGSQIRNGDRKAASLAPAINELEVNEIYVKARGKWPYLYRALDKLHP